MAWLIIIGVSVALAISITLAGTIYEKSLDKDAPKENITKNEIILEDRSHPDAITSGPLTITKYQHKLGENIFIIVNGLGPNEKGNIRIFLPDGRLYRTLQYDGSVKSDFNSYFKPDTSQIRKICEQEELVGRWPVLFDNNVYPPLVFEIINEHLNGPNVRLTKSC